jgi:hypothetical protein
MAEFSEVASQSPHVKKIDITEERIQKIEEDPEWSICCSKSSSHFIKYLVQVLVSLTILIFAIVMIATGHDDSVYWSLVTLIIGVFVPSPSLTNPKV